MKKVVFSLISILLCSTYAANSKPELLIGRLFVEFHEPGNNQMRGTAFAITPKSLLTAAHNFYSAGLKKFKEADFYSGLQEGSGYVEHVKITKYILHPKWKRSVDSKNINRSYDIAICLLGKSLSIDMPFFVPAKLYDNLKELLILGYPTNTLKESRSSLSALGGGKIYYTGDEIGEGQSGGPILTYKSLEELQPSQKLYLTWWYKVFGLHTCLDNVADKLVGAAFTNKRINSFIAPKIKEYLKKTKAMQVTHDPSVVFSSNNGLLQINTENLAEAAAFMANDPQKIVAMNIVLEASAQVPSDFSKLKNLVLLNLYGGFCPNFNSVTGLHSLTIDCVAKFKLSSLNNLKKLRLFSIKSCRNLYTGDFSLSGLLIAQFSDVTFNDLGFLEKCNQLEYLLITNNPNFYDIGNFVNSKSLKVLRLKNISNKMNFKELIKCIIKLPKLGEVELRQTGMQKILTEAFLGALVTEQNVISSTLQVKVGELNEEEEEES